MAALRGERRLLVPGGGESSADTAGIRPNASTAEPSTVLRPVSEPSAPSGSAPPSVAMLAITISGAEEPKARKDAPAASSGIW